MVAPETEGNGNGKVTMAVLATKLDYVISIMGECKIAIANQDENANKLNDRVTRMETKFEDFDALKKAVIANIVTFIVAVLGGAYVLLTKLP